MRSLFDFSTSPASLGITILGTARSIIHALREAQQERATTWNSSARRNTSVLWRHASPMEDFPTSWVPHRVVRWNHSSVLVEAYPFMPEGYRDEWKANHRNRTYRLNRWELDQIGVTRVQSRSIAFFASPRVTDEAVATVESLMRLDLWFPFTEQDLRQTYIRRALRAHPDAGGSDEKFLQLQRDQERATTALSHPANSS